jgi:hypothetical protein
MPTAENPDRFDPIGKEIENVFANPRIAGLTSAMDRKPVPVFEQEGAHSNEEGR